jgi:hypothetical protein
MNVRVCAQCFRGSFTLKAGAFMLMRVVVCTCFWRRRVPPLFPAVYISICKVGSVLVRRASMLRWQW